MGRMGTCDGIAKAAEALASDDSSYVTTVVPNFLSMVVQLKSEFFSIL